MEFREYRFTNGVEYIFGQPLLDGYANDAITSVVNNKDRILSLMKTPVYEVKPTDGLGYISYVCVCENGLRVDFHIAALNEQTPEEFSSLYFFNNGDVFYVFGGLNTSNFGFIGGNPNITCHLEDRLGRTYEFMEREKGVKGVFSHTHSNNKKLLELCKTKFETLVLSSKINIEFTEYDDNNQKILRV